MASDIKKRTQVAVDAISTTVTGCSLAMLIDGETGLVLCKTTGTVVSQDQLDEVAANASAELNGSLCTALSENATAKDLLSATQVHKDTTVVALRAAKSNQDALICQFTSPPNRDALASAARAVFALSAEGEAA